MGSERIGGLGVGRIQQQPKDSVSVISGNLNVDLKMGLNVFNSN